MRKPRAFFVVITIHLRSKAHFKRAAEVQPQRLYFGVIETYCKLCNCFYMCEIFLFGDSITWGSWDPDHGGWAQLLRQEIDRLQLNQSDLWCPLYNLGVPGDTAAGIAKRIENEITARHDQSQEMVVMIAIGINDSMIELPSGRATVQIEDFRYSLALICQAIKRFQASVYFVGLNPVDESLVNPVPWNPHLAYTAESTALFDAELAQFCAANGYPFISLRKSWMAKQWSSLLHDGLHPNSPGHYDIYELVRSVVIPHITGETPPATRHP